MDGCVHGGDEFAAIVQVRANACTCPCVLVCLSRYTALLFGHLVYQVRVCRVGVTATVDADAREQVNNWASGKAFRGRKAYLMSITVRITDFQQALGHADAITVGNKTITAEARVIPITGLEAAPPSAPTIQAPITKSICIHPRPPRRKAAPLKKRPVKVKAIAARQKLLILSQPFSYPDPTQSEKGDAFDALIAKLRLLELETIQFETSAKKSSASRSRPTSGSAKTSTTTNRRLSQQHSKNQQNSISACLYHTSSVPVLNHTNYPQARKLKKSTHKFQCTTTASSSDLISASLSSITDMHVSVLSPPPPPSVPGPFPSRDSPDANHLRQGDDTPQPSLERDITIPSPSPVHCNDNYHCDPGPLAEAHRSDSDDTPTAPQATIPTSALCQTAVLRNARITPTTGSRISTSTTDIRGGRLTPTKPQVNISTARTRMQGRSCPSQLRGAKPLVFTSIVRPCTPGSHRDGSLRSHSS